MMRIGNARSLLSLVDAGHNYVYKYIKEVEGEEEENSCTLYGFCCDLGNEKMSIGTYSIDILTFVLSIILLITLCFLIIKLSLNYISLQVITFKPNGFQTLKPINDAEEEEENKNALFSRNIYNSNSNDSSYSTFSFSDHSNQSNKSNNTNGNNSNEYQKKNKVNFFQNSNDDYSNNYGTSSDTESMEFPSPSNNNNNNNLNNKKKKKEKKKEKKTEEPNRNFDFEENQNHQLRENSLRPVHFLYILLVVTWLIVQSLILLIPMPTTSSTFLQIVDALLYEVHSFLDNAIIILAFFKTDKLTSVVYTIILSFSLMLALSVTGYTYEIMDSCGICELFFPAPQAFYTYLFLSILYLLLLVLLYSNSSRKPRKTIRVWTWYLFLIYFGSMISSSLVLFWNVDAGFCMIDVIVFVYTIAYSPLLYYVLVRDSNKLYKNEESLLKNLDPSDTEAVIERAMELCKRYKIGLIPFHFLHFGERLGVGAAGEVYKANYLGTPIAVKRLFDKKSQALEEFFREVTVMSKLSHPNIILFMGVSISGGGDRYIITEIMDKGSVFDLIHPNLSFSALRNPDSDNDLSGPRVKRILIQCARGIAYLHSFQPPILHRDLKSHNLLVDNNWNVKVADFGLSRTQSLTTMTAAGTPQWSAPEVIRQDYYTEKADVYSFGVIIFELLSREIPYMNMGPLTAAHQVAYEGLRLRFPQGSDPAYVQLAEDCWEENPSDRPNFTDIVKQLEVLPPPVIVPKQPKR